jgi:hypothetical protein
MHAYQLLTGQVGVDEAIAGGAAFACEQNGRACAPELDFGQNLTALLNRELKALTEPIL